MGSKQDQHSGCLFPFGDDFLPILAFFFNINDLRKNADTIQPYDLKKVFLSNDD